MFYWLKNWGNLLLHLESWSSILLYYICGLIMVFLANYQRQYLLALCDQIFLLILPKECFFSLRNVPFLLDSLSIGIRAKLICKNHC